MTHRGFRVALIGCGRWGRNLLKTLAIRDDLQLTWVVDPDDAARRLAHERVPGVQTFASTDLLREARPDVIVIASPGPMHALHCRVALDCGADFFVEKPMTMDVREAATIAQQAERRGLVGMVGHLLHYHPAYRSCLDLVRRGELGLPLQMRAVRTVLRTARDPDGSVLWSLAPHDVSLFRAIDPSAIAQIDAHAADARLTVSIGISTARGGRADILVSRTRNRRIRKTIVVCQRGHVVLDDTLPSKKVAVYRAEERSPEWLSYDEQAEPLREEVDAFVRCVRDRSEPPTSLTDGHEVVALLARAQSMMESSISCRPPVEAAR